MIARYASAHDVSGLIAARFSTHADKLMKNKTSFIYGESPDSAVPIYAVVNMCSGDGDFNHKNGNNCSTS